ncbi:ATP-binding protein [Falsiroseomonas sp. HC035]|uniref:sensor histidine kinase n=1 Tax=Falsiroseomonas sp. HC035 TaxID=3390999 RepID=UPI003D32174B
MKPPRPLPRRGGPRGLMLLRAVAVVLPLLALGALGLGAHATVDSDARGRAQRAVDMLHEHALRAFEAQELAIAAIEARMAGIAWEDVPHDRELYNFILRVDAVNLSSAGLALIDPRNLLVMSSALPFGATPRDVSNRDYVAAQPAGLPIPDQPFIGQVVRSVGNAALVFPMVRPRQRPQGDGLSDGGSILAGLWLSTFQDFYRSILETPEDAITLFRMDGAVLAAVPAPAQAEGAALPRTAGDVLTGLRRAPFAILRGPSPIDGVPRMTAFRRLARHDIGIAYGISEAALNRDWRRRMVGPLLGAGLGMLLLLAAIRQAEHALRARAAAEARSRDAERQATLGLLAGGLAHDFGNITQSVVAAATLLGRHAEDAERVRKIAGHLARHAQRATTLSRRLLATTRRTTLPEANSEIVDVSTSLREVCELLDATLGAGLRVRCDVPAGLRSAPGLDRAELETAVINLAANSRDAMPHGGEVWVEATVLEVPPRLAGAPDLPPGRYLRISVRDQGEGMAPEALARLGEPFFTTKPAGRGTGLGLAMVAAFLRRAGGALTAESTPGQGTTIHMVLPAG